jgi:hypothetical protein
MIHHVLQTIPQSDYRFPDQEASVSGHAKGPHGVQWQERIDLVRLRIDRVKTVRNALRTSACDALLLWKDENVGYLTSLRAQLIAGKMAALNGVLVTADAGPILLCSGGESPRTSRGSCPGSNTTSDCSTETSVYGLVPPY